MQATERQVILLSRDEQGQTVGDGMLGNKGQIGAVPPPSGAPAGPMPEAWHALQDGSRSALRSNESLVLALQTASCTLS